MCSSDEEDVAEKDKTKRRKGEKVHNITNEIIKYLWFGQLGNIFKITRDYSDNLKQSR